MDIEGEIRFVSSPSDMRKERRKVLISFSRDMADWARRVADRCYATAWRLRDADFDIVFWHRLEPELANGAEAWADHITATSDPRVELVIVLLGERVGRPTPRRFSGARRMAKTLRNQDIPWIKIQGIDKDFDLTKQQPDDFVPLTGTLYEYLDAKLNGVREPTGATRPHLMLAIYGSSHETHFGFGREATRIASIPSRAERREEQQEYHLQEAWVTRLYDGFIKGGEAPEIWFSEEEDLLARVDRVLAHLFGGRFLDPFETELPQLLAYRQDQASLYFGFGADARRLEDLLHAQQIVVVEGGSGAGKSSLLRAGLLARLASPMHRGLGWRAAIETPDTLADAPTPVTGISRAVAKALRPDVEIDPMREFDDLSPLPDGFAALERRLRQYLPTERQTRLVLVLDQAEALLDRLAAERALPAGQPQPWSDMFEGLLNLARACPIFDRDAATDASALAGRLSVSLVFGITSVRAPELVGQLPDTRSIERLTLKLNPDGDRLREIVDNTFEAMGLRLEPALTDQIVDEATGLGRSFGGLEGTPVLPLLSVSLTAVHHAWRNAALAMGERGRAPAERAPLQQRDFGEIARLGAAIELLGERAWLRAFPPLPAPPGYRRRRIADPEAPQRDVRFGRMMRRLVTVSAWENGERYRHAPQPVTVDDPMLQDVSDLVGALRAERLIVAHSEQQLRLAHESVLRYWPRAADWVVLEEQYLRTRFDLRRDLDRWRERAQAPDYLITRLPDLVDAAAILLAWGEDLDATAPGLADFIRASLAAAYPFANAEPQSPLRRLAWNACGLGETRLIEDLLQIDANLPEEKLDDTGVSPLMLAAEQGHVQIVEALLRAGAAPNAATTSDGRTALLMAAQNGYTSVVETLLRTEADPNQATPSGGRTPLLLAAQNGHGAIVEALLSAKADPNHLTTEDGRTALIMAAQEGHASIVEALLQFKADPNHAQKNDNRTALLQAAQNGHSSIVEALLGAGADPNHAMMENGCTALIMAAQNGHASIVVTLLDANANPNYAQNDDGLTALVIAAQNGHTPIVEALLWAGADPNAATTDAGSTALILAAQNGHRPIVEALLRAKADPNHAQSNDGRTALIQAAQNGYASIVEALLHAKADPNRTTMNEGQTALMQAAQNGHASIVEALLHAKADPNQATTEDGRTALIQAAQNGHGSIVDALLRAKADPNHAQSNDGRTALIQAAQNGHGPIVGALLRAKADPNHAQSNDGRTALIQAAQNGHGSIVEALLRAKADPNHAQSNDGRTALIQAAQEGHGSIVEALLRAKADPNHAQSNDGRTALIQAAQEGHALIVDALLRAKADPNHAQSNGGRTALIQAAQEGHALIVDALLRAKANPNHVRNDHGFTALILAAQEGHLLIVEALLHAKADPNHAAAGGGPTALMMAAQEGHLLIVEALLHAKADPNRATTGNCITALMMAAQNGHAPIVEALLSVGADPNAATTGDGHTALMMAALNGHALIVDALLGVGAAPNAAATDNGHTALMMAAQNGHAPIVEALLGVGADPNASTIGDGHTALMIAALNGHAPIVDALLGVGADPNAAATDDGHTALMMAALNGHAPIVEVLLGVGADPNCSTADGGSTALDVAMHGSRTVVASLLLAVGGKCSKPPGEPYRAIELPARFLRLGWQPAPDAMDIRSLAMALGLSDAIGDILPLLALGDAYLIRFASPSTEEEAVDYRFLLRTQSAIAALDRTNDPFYAVAEVARVDLVHARLSDYVISFFSLVIGSLGHFEPVEIVDDIPWTEAATDEDRTRVATFLYPMRTLGVRDGVQYLRTPVVFHKALFHTDIRVEASGQMELADEDLMLEDQPFRDTRSSGAVGDAAPISPEAEVDHSSREEESVAHPLRARILEELPEDPEPWCDQPLLPIAADELQREALADVIIEHLQPLNAIFGGIRLPERGRTILIDSDAQFRLVEYQFALPIGSGEVRRAVLTFHDGPETVVPMLLGQGHFAEIIARLPGRETMVPSIAAALFLAVEPNADSYAIPLGQEDQIPWLGRPAPDQQVRAMLAVRQSTQKSASATGVLVEQCWLEMGSLFRGTVLVARDPAETEVVGDPQVLIQGLAVKRRVLLDNLFRYLDDGAPTDSVPTETAPVPPSTSG